MTPRLSVAIAGAGMGGLALAAGLAPLGIPCTIFEKQAEVASQGSALLMGGNAVKAMYDLGLATPFERLAFPRAGGQLRSSSGRLLLRIPDEVIQEVFGHPHMHIERGDLREVLLSGVDRSSIRYRCAVKSFEEAGAEVRLHLADGSSQSFDVLAGADGIGSVVRAGLHGEDRAPYAGYTAWQGASTLDLDWPKGDALDVWGLGRRTGFVYLGRGRWGWWASARCPPGGRDPDEGRAKAVARPFREWGVPNARLILSTPDAAIQRHDIHYRVPDGRWGRGRVTLLGDAAHLMTPDIGQGACQAIIDGLLLARALTGAPSQGVGAALRGFEGRRATPTAVVAARSRRTGRQAHLNSRALLVIRNAVIAAVPNRLWAASTKRAIASAGY